MNWTPIGLLLALALASCAKISAAPEQPDSAVQVMTGDALAATCGDGSQTGVAACWGYVAGVVDATESAFSIAHPNERWLCQSPKPPAIASAVRGYIQTHPDQLHNGGESLVFYALNDAFAKGCDHAKPW